MFGSELQADFFQERLIGRHINRFIAKIGFPAEFLTGYFLNLFVQVIHRFPELKGSCFTYQVEAGSGYSGNPIEFCGRATHDGRVFVF